MTRYRLIRGGDSTGDPEIPLEQIEAWRREYARELAELVSDETTPTEIIEIAESRIRRLDAVIWERRMGGK